MATPQQSSLSSVIRARMEERGITQGELAEILNVSQPAISRRLAGIIDWRVSELEAIAAYMGVDVSGMITNEVAA